MSRKYGKSKLHGGAGLQFDKLLKACSNSKKPSVTKTAGALGRFGIASFTSTRNANFDADSCGMSYVSCLEWLYGNSMSDRWC